MIPVIGALIVFAGIIALISGIARALGAPRWLAVCIPSVPLGLWFAHSVVFKVFYAGEGGGLPGWILAGPLFVVALISSMITVFIIIPKKHDKPST